MSGPVVEIVKIGPAELDAYAAIQSEVLVAERVVRKSIAGARPGPLRTEPVSQPYVKRYGDHADSDPLHWPRLFALDRWGLYLARRGDTVVGSAAVARSDAVSMLESGSGGSGVLWDIRVAASHRCTGVGTALFRAAELWAASRGLPRLIVETQDVNVPACRFYMSMGCTLASWEAGAYDGKPDEARLVWQRTISEARR